jgi:3-deoxy-D-manno-octulosonic-acid transferase
MPIEEQMVCQGLYSTGMIIVYNLIMAVAIFLLWPIWVPVVWTRNKHRDTFFKRLFMQALSPIGPESPVARRPIWIHALSVGEVLSAESLVKALAQKHGPRALVFTASTQTGVEMATRLIAPHVSAVRYFPYDALFSVNRALRVIQPRQVVIVETDIWPNFLYRLRRCRIPVHLVNARLSERSFRGYRRVGWLMAPLLSVFGRICVQTDSDRQRFRTLGVPDENVATVGNIKFDQPPATLSTAEIKQLREQFKLPADVPIWVAGSTHEGEEDVLSVAYRAVYASGIHPALIVAPRDPGRADSVCTLFKRSGCNASILAHLEKQPVPPSVVVIDRIGILRKLYALADVAFVGGSLVKAGGHNPLEPASVAKPVLIGPHTEDFRWICQTLEAAGGAIRVHDAQQLAATVIRLIANQADCRGVGRRAYQVFAENRGAVARTLAVIESCADRGDR